MKWGFLPKDNPKPRYLCVNADESEPGTFKDRQIIEHNPHLLLEGILISAYAIQSHTAYIYIRGEFAHGAKVLEAALSRGVRARGTWAPTSTGPDSTSTCTCTAAPARTSAAKRPG